MKDLYKFYLTGKQPINASDILDFAGRYSPSKDKCLKSINGSMIIGIKLEYNDMLLFTDGKIWA